MSKTKRPFHETIIDAINRTRNIREMESLGILIKETKIPKGHDDIIHAWTLHRDEMGGNEDDDFGVIADLFEQKKQTNEKEMAKKEEIPVS